MKTIDGDQLSVKELALLGRDEEPVFAARPDYATVHEDDHWSTPLLLLTDRRLIISKQKILGKPKIDFECVWPEVNSVTGELWNGGGPKIQLIVVTSRSDVEFIVRPQIAVGVESAIRSGYVNLK